MWVLVGAKDFKDENEKAWGVGGRKRRELTRLKHAFLKNYYYLFIFFLEVKKNTQGRRFWACSLKNRHTFHIQRQSTGSRFKYVDHRLQERWTTCGHVLPPYKSKAKIAGIWATPSCAPPIQAAEPRHRVPDHAPSCPIVRGAQLSIMTLRLAFRGWNNSLKPNCWKKREN